MSLGERGGGDGKRGSLRDGEGEGARGREKRIQMRRTSGREVEMEGEN